MVSLIGNSINSIAPRIPPDPMGDHLTLFHVCQAGRKLIPKTIQKQCKMVLGRCLGHVRGLPEASRWQVRAGFGPQAKVDENMEGFRNAPGTSREAPRQPEESEKSTENQVFAEEWRFKRGFLVDVRARYRISSFFVRISINF